MRWRSSSPMPSSTLRGGPESPLARSHGWRRSDGPGGSESLCTSGAVWVVAVGVVVVAAVPALLSRGDGVVVVLPGFASALLPGCGGRAPPGDISPEESALVSPCGITATCGTESTGTTGATSAV